MTPLHIDADFSGLRLGVFGLRVLVHLPQFGEEPLLGLVLVEPALDHADRNVGDAEFPDDALRLAAFGVALLLPLGEALALLLFPIVVRVVVHVRSS